MRKRFFVNNTRKISFYGYFYFGSFPLKNELYHP